jgi:phosphate uptake regulator
MSIFDNVAYGLRVEAQRVPTQLIQVAHELERVADRATNIAERVVYAVKGELVDLNA